MKEMNKAKIYIKKSMKAILNEKNLLEELHYPLLSNMNYAFQTEEFLYIIMDYLPGGDLRYHLSKRKKYNQKEIKFLISNIILSLKYLHSKHIIHRDIKPENLVFDVNGYIHLTDLGISSKYYRGNSLINSSGTPSYMAPEVMLRKNHEFSVDFFALGIITYELIFGKRPFNGKNRNEIKQEVLHKDIKIRKSDLPKDNYWDYNICSFVNLLLKRKACLRLGYKGIFEIMEHEFLKDINWKKIEKKEVNSPFYINENNENFNSDYVNQADDENIYQNKKKYFINIVNESGFFKSFYFNREEYETNINNYDVNKNRKKVIRGIYHSYEFDNRSSTARGNTNDRTNEISIFQKSERKKSQIISPYKLNEKDNDDDISEIQEENSHTNLYNNNEDYSYSSLD